MTLPNFIKMENIEELFDSVDTIGVGWINELNIKIEHRCYAKADETKSNHLQYIQYDKY